MMRRLARVVVVAALSASTLSCDESTGNAGGIQITPGQVQLTVTQGGVASTTVTLIRTGGFSGLVTLSVNGLPGGVLASVTPTQLSGAELSATVELGAGTTAPQGTSTVNVVATADGVTQSTAPLELTIAPAPNFRLTLSPSSMTVQTGGSGAATVNIERTNFSGDIQLSLLNPPPGVTAVFTPATVDASSASLTISAETSVLPASYPLIVRGVAAGVGARTTQVNLLVQAPPGSFSVAITPGAFALPRGNSASANIVISRTDFGGAISLAFENSSPGITGSITPATTTGNSAAFNIDVSDAVAAGIYQLRVRASAQGFVDRVAFVGITVTVPTGGNVEYLYCDASQVPAFLAYQDGSGAWKAVIPTTAGVITKFAFTLVQDRGGVLAVYRTASPLVTDAARVRPWSAMTRAFQSRQSARQAPARGLRSSGPNRALLVDQYTTEVLYASTPELTQGGTENCAMTQQQTRTISAHVTNLTPGHFGVVSLGDLTRVLDSEAFTNPIALSGVREGPIDLVASRFVPGNAPERLVLMRGIDVTDGATVPNAVDFAGPFSSSAATATATLNGGSGDLLEMFASVVTLGTEALLWFDLSPSATNVRPWGGFSSTVQQAGDFHGLTAFATPVSGNGSFDFRVTQRYVTAVSNQVMNFGPAMTIGTATEVAAGLYPRYRIQGSIPDAYNKGLSIDFASSNAGGNGYGIIASRSWLVAGGNAQAYDITMPDVAALAGFPVAARLAPGSNDLAVSAFAFTGQGIFDLRPAVNQEFRAASRAIAVNVP